jgi:protein arginine kinase activator
MKCQKCTKAATLHITEVLGEDRYDDLHLCEDCAQKYLEPQSKKSGDEKLPVPGGHGLEEAGVLNRECPECGIKFVEFRNSGRLGCPHDYDAFHDDLILLMENIHGETKHCGKVPRRLPQAKQAESELMQLRKRLLEAVNEEAYEEAARIRDRIREVEGS